MINSRPFWREPLVHFILIGAALFFMFELIQTPGDDAPDRIVVGVDSDRSREVMRELYKDFSRNHDRILFMGVKDAEMTKYAGNSMLATKISFINEMATLCEAVGADVHINQHIFNGSLHSSAGMQVIAAEG